MPETLFSLVNLIAMAGWVGLSIAACLRAGDVRNVLLRCCGRGAPIVLCIAYAGFLVRYWGTTSGGGFHSLASVQALFASPGVLLAGWTHYLAFDLLIGRWMVDDASSDGRTRIPLVWSLPATFLLGPVGVLLYLASRVLFGLAAGSRRPGSA